MRRCRTTKGPKGELVLHSCTERRSITAPRRQCYHHHPTARVPLACLAARLAMPASLSRCLLARAAACIAASSSSKEFPSPSSVAAIVGFVLSHSSFGELTASSSELESSRQQAARLGPGIRHRRPLPALQMQVRAKLSCEPLATPFAGPPREKQGQ